MRKRDDIIKKINKAIILEEEAIDIYTKHINTVLSWSGLNPQTLAYIRDKLTTLATESHKHKVYFLKIKGMITKTK